MTRLFGVSKTAAVMCYALGGLFLFFLVIGLLVSVFIYPFEAPAPYALGLFVGCASSVLKVILMEKSLGKAADMEEKGAKNYGALMAMSRYFLTIAVFLLVVFFRDIFGLFGTIIGVLALQFSAYIANFVLRKNSSAQL
ncbi:MAG: ATP synthase subunit I [Oscillospiraceae bacterium]|jgi:hypothetical protein|nr:ATP synthase subunit I [Oscillospiraceae bacterium]